jgi:hypothetical protein
MDSWVTWRYGKRALVINGHVISVGKVSPRAKLIECLKEAEKEVIGNKRK